VLVGSSASAHHSVEAFFDQSMEIEVRGTVERWIFRNPHPVLFVVATDADGAEVQWQVHFPPATVLAKRGYSATTFQAGDEVVATGNPSRQPGTHGIEYRGIVTR
jgi:hypothetical protein